MSIKENILRLKENLPEKVTLVAVSKTKPNELILEAYEAGQRDFGENRVQEVVPKYNELPKDIRWHVIGHLQTNKVKYIAPFVHLIHSVDSENLLAEINKQAAKCNRVIPVLLQIFIAQEETKFGFSFEEAEKIMSEDFEKKYPFVKVEVVRSTVYPLLTRILNEARVPIVTDPHTGPLHARVKELLAEKVLVCLGQDDISDAYYPFGRNNMLEVAFLASHLLWMMTRQDIDKLYDMITIDAAAAINVAGFGLAEGAAANLVVLDQPDVVEALRFHRAPAHVISHGKLVDQAKMRAIASAGPHV